MSETIREAAKRQIMLLAFYGLFPCGSAGATEPRNVADELRAAKLVESSVMARAADPSQRGKEIEKLDGLYLELEQKHPSDASIRNARAAFLWSVDRQSEALAEWLAAERVDPQNAATAYRLGDCFLTFGDAKKATEYFSRATKIDPANAYYHLTFGNALFLFRKELVGISGTDADAIANSALGEFRTAAELDPWNAEYAKSYAETFYGIARADWEEAIRAWTRYLEITHNKDFAYSNLARVNLKLGRKEAARGLLGKIEGKDFDAVKRRLLKQAEGD